MGFCWSTLKVKELEESIRFYTEVIGLEVVNRFNAGPTGDIVFLGSGETKVELICDGSNRDIVVGEDISWGFEIDSIDRLLTLIDERSIQIVGGPVQPNPHVKFLFIKDPNGLTVQLVENIA